jgi:hypothetical protein
VAAPVTGPDTRRIIFLHIHKTGGMTIRHFLKRRYRDASVDIRNVPNHGEHTMGPPDRGQNDAFLEKFWALPREQRDAMRVCYGHLSYGLHERLPGPSTYITLLRDPIDRVLSMHEFQRVKRGLELSLRDYVMNLAHVGDQQTRRLAGGDWARGLPNTDGMLEAAKQHLTDHFAVVGVTELWDETLLVMADTFGWKRLRYDTHNESPGRLRREAVDDEVLEVIRRQNLLDQELYQFARDRFEARLARDHPDMERRVRRLRRANPVWLEVDRQMKRGKQIPYTIRSGAARTYHRVSGR